MPEPSKRASPKSSSTVRAARPAGTDGAAHDEETSENRAAISAAAFVAKRLGGRSPPTSARRIAEITADPSFQVADVVTLLESDPALSARLLQIVNSAGYAPRTGCRSVHRAVMLLGATRLRAVTTAAGVLHLFDVESPAAYRVREHSTVVGALARSLAPLCALPPDEMFTCGALHDLGKLMLLEAEEDEYCALLERNGDRFDRLYARERARYGFDHAMLAGHVLRAWRIPDPVPRVVAWHHDPLQAEREDRDIAARVHLLRLADRLSCELFSGAPFDAITDLIAEDDGTAFFGLPPRWCEERLPALRDLAFEVRDSLAEQDVQRTSPGDAGPPTPAAPLSRPRSPAVAEPPTRWAAASTELAAASTPPALLPAAAAGRRALPIAAGGALLTFGGIAVDVALVHGLALVAGASGIAAVVGALGVARLLRRPAAPAHDEAAPPSLKAPSAPPRTHAASPPAAGPSSPNETLYIRWTVDPRTGETGGVVRRGPLRGRALGELSLSSLRELHAECIRADPAGTTALEAFLERSFGATWRTTAPSRRNELSREEALRMLGLGSSAPRGEIRAAYRRLVMKLHPDHGGTDYLAAKLNEARERLLGH